MAPIFGCSPIAKKTPPRQGTIEQYKSDRKPIYPKTKRKEPLLTPNRGAIVPFALPKSAIAITTALAEESTYFYPLMKRGIAVMYCKLFRCLLIIVATARTVLDTQLQEAMQQLGHQQGLTAAINRDCR